tara:strand:- start:902 stop:2587 length:1686 start_codon:yes stop_codon:yes gene_type:complete
MVSNYLIFFLSYFLIVLSVIGHGFLAIKLSKINISKDEIGFVGLVGIFFLILYSYLTHFFISHGYLHNIIFLLIGIISLYNFRSKVFNKQNITYIFCVFSIIFLAFVIFKTHDDFGYYHFPYSYYLNKFSMIIGIGPLNLGFRTPSSIFYLNSLFYFPYIEYYLYHISVILIMGFSNIILISNIKNHLEKEKNNQFFFLNFLTFLFINIFFYRIAEHGTDRSAQILIFLFLIYILSLRGNYKNFENILPKLIILLGIIISIKSFYVLYLIFLIPFIYYLFLDKKKNLIPKIFNNSLFYLSIFLGFCVVLVYFFNTGCLLYPIQQTCITAVEWAIPKTEVSALNTHYQWWSKAGGGPGYRSSIEPEIYIQNFNWLSNWIDRYFFNKVSDFLLSLSFISIIFILMFKSEKLKLKKSSFQYNAIYYYLILLLFFEWFLQHPSLRYGGYVIISLIFFIPLSFFLSKYKTQDNFKLKVVSLCLLTVLIFLGRNIDRIIYENKFYKANFKENMFFFTDKIHFRIHDKLNEFSKNYQDCNLDKDKCLNDKDFIIKKSNGKLIIIKTRN